MVRTKRTGSKANGLGDLSMNVDDIPGDCGERLLTPMNTTVSDVEESSSPDCIESSECLLMTWYTAAHSDDSQSSRHL